MSSLVASASPMTEGRMPLGVGPSSRIEPWPWDDRRMGAAPDVGDHDFSSTRMCSDGYRALLAIVPSLVIPAVAGIVVSFVRQSSNQVILAVILSLIGWNVFVVVYVLLTVRTFSGADSALFRMLMATRSAVRSQSRALPASSTTGS